MKRAALIGAGLAVVAVLAVLVLGRGDDHTVPVHFRLDNAVGLTDGSPVLLGGVQVGEVELDAEQEDVKVTLKIREKYWPLDRQTKVAIMARNALGQKAVFLQPVRGARRPASPGYTLPARQVEVATDLDQLLNTLDGDTRARLAILLNELGIAFEGRKLDFRALLTDLAPALGSGTDLLGQLTGDNRALANLVEESDRVVATLAAERRRLTAFIDEVNGALETMAGRRQHLQETLRAAPATLSAARSFLGELRRTTSPLEQAAKQLTSTAPPLLRTLEQLEPFRRSAEPTLRAATRATPAIDRLARRTTSSLRGAIPLLRSLQEASETEVPEVGLTLDRSMDNLLATVDNWSRAVQFRDRLGHMFRGEVTVAPSLYERYLATLGLAERPIDEPPRSTDEAKEKAPSARARSRTRSWSARQGRAPAEDSEVQGPGEPVDGRPSDERSAGANPLDVRPLLEYLLGK